MSFLFYLPVKSCFIEPVDTTGRPCRDMSKWIDNLKTVLKGYELRLSSAALKAKERKLFLPATPRQGY